MAVTNDGFGNYFSGNEVEGVGNSILQTDFISILDTLGVSYVKETAGNATFAIRPSGDTLTGTQGTPTLFTTSSNITDQSRINMYVGGRTGNASLSPMFILNSSTTNTEINIRGDSTGQTINNWNANLHTSSTNWAVVTNKSFTWFSYLNSNYYILVSCGVLDNNIEANTPFPNSLYGFYTGKYNGTKLSSFQGITANSSTARGLLKSGALDTNLNSANYIHEVSSGSSQVASHFGLRNSSNGYMIGTVPNIIKVKSTQSLTVGQIPYDLDNLTQGNNSILGSTNDRFMVVGRLDSTGANDDLGDYLLMRVKKI